MIIMRFLVRPWLTNYEALCLQSADRLILFTGSVSLENPSTKSYID